MYCSNCRTNQSSDLFSHPSRAAPYKTCSNCRSRERSRRRRRPTIFQAQPVSGPSRPIHDIHYGADNIEVNAEESALIAEDSIMNDNPTVVLPQLENIEFSSHLEAQNIFGNEKAEESLPMRDRQALTDDEPFLLLSHTNSQEYITHMQVREALPDDHDNIFETECGSQFLNNENIDNQGNEVAIESAISGVHGDVNLQQPDTETTCPAACLQCESCYPHGNPRYHRSIPLQNKRVQGDVDESQDGTRRGCVSARQFYRYHLFSRQDPETLATKFNALIHGEKLFQQLCCDMYASVDDNPPFDLISIPLIDALRSDSSTQIGEPVILASSYIGGDRHMTKCFQNAMAITRAIGNPSIFLTFTANPSWLEIVENLKHNQTSDSRPDLVAKVFKLKLDQYLYDINERHVYGVQIGSQYSIEYQKRGLPHAHLLMFLYPDCVPRTPEQVPKDDPVLAEIVKSQLTHGPCGSGFPNAPCMRDDKCSKGYPKRWCETTILRENSYLEYARPDNGVHINVEITYGVHAIKYLAKYVYKGSDRATLAVPGEHNEIDMTLQGRYIGPVQAIWRLMGYTTHEEKPAVMQLPYQLEGRHRVAFSRVMTREQIIAADLYTVDGVNYETPSATCRALGLIFDDSEWISLFDEIKDSTSAASLRNQFGVILANSEVLDPQGIWDRFREAFSDDCLYRISSLGTDLDASPLEWSEEKR
ncbi:hypothetical protein EPUL_003713, partial [Erysiphe pulchra]